MVVHESGGGGENLGLAGARRGREVTACRRTEGSAKVCFLLAALRWVDHQADDTPLLHGDVDDNIEDIYRDLRRVRSVRYCGERWDGSMGRQTAERLSLLASSVGAVAVDRVRFMLSLCLWLWLLRFHLAPTLTTTPPASPYNDSACTTRLYARRDTHR
jgi:NAD(P)-dependent dehydrogenase (short-subunit alcohol dehydrogenase family)